MADNNSNRPPLKNFLVLFIPTMLRFLLPSSKLLISSKDTIVQTYIVALSALFCSFLFYSTFASIHQCSIRPSPRMNSQIFIFFWKPTSIHQQKKTIKSSETVEELQRAKGYITQANKLSQPRRWHRPPTNFGVEAAAEDDDWNHKKRRRNIMNANKVINKSFEIIETKIFHFRLMQQSSSGAVSSESGVNRIKWKKWSERGGTKGRKLEMEKLCKPRKLVSLLNLVATILKIQQFPHENMLHFHCHLPTSWVSNFPLNEYFIRFPMSFFDLINHYQVKSKIQSKLKF